MNGRNNILAVSKDFEMRLNSKPSTLETQVAGKDSTDFAGLTVAADLEQEMEDILSLSIWQSTCYDKALKL